MGYKRNNDRHAEICQRYREGQSGVKIGRALGISKQRVYQILDENEVYPRHGKGWPLGVRRNHRIKPVIPSHLFRTFDKLRRNLGSEVARQEIARMIEA